MLDAISAAIGWREVIIGLAIALGAVLLPIILPIIAGIASIVGVFALAVGAAALLRTAWVSNFGGIRDYAASVWESIIGAYHAFRALFSGDWEGFLTGIHTAFVTAWQGTITFLGNLWSMVQPTLSGWFESVVTWFQSQDWRKLASDAIGFIVEGFSTFGELTTPTFTTWFQSIVTWFQSQDWAGMASTAVTAITTAIGDMWSFTGPKLVEWIEAMTTWIETQDWGALGYNIIQALLAGFVEGIALVGATLIALAVAMYEWLKGGGLADLREAFNESIFAQIDQALKDMMDAVKQAIVDLLKGALMGAIEFVGLDRLGGLVGIGDGNLGGDETIGLGRTVTGLADTFSGDGSFFDNTTIGQGIASLNPFAGDRQQATTDNRQYTINVTANQPEDAANMVIEAVEGVGG